VSHITHPLDETDGGSLSPWWIRWILIVMVIGFSGLITVTMLSYKNAPPIPHQIVDPLGAVVISSDDIGNGQTIFLKYGLMDNGSIWGHGAYLGPDYAADTLHRMGIDTANAIAQQQYQRPLLALDAAQQAGVWAQTAVDLKTNRYDPTTCISPRHKSLPFSNKSHIGRITFVIPNTMAG
jgi:nitric oxide reductase subunit B